MADVTEVIHRITYEVNNDALNNVTAAIQAQLAELNKLNLALSNYNSQLSKFSSAQIKEIDAALSKIDNVHKQISKLSGNIKGTLLEVLSGIANGLSGNDSLKDAVSKYVSLVISHFDKLQSAGKVTATGLAANLSKAGATIGNIASAIGTAGKAFFSFSNIIGVVLNVLPLLIDMFSGTADNVDEASESINRFQKAMDDVAKDIAHEIVEIDKLLIVAQDVMRSYAERSEAVDMLQKQYPAYFGALEKEKILNGDIKTAYDEATKSIIAQAESKVKLAILEEALLKQQRAKLALDEYNNSKTSEGYDVFQYDPGNKKKSELESSYKAAVEYVERVRKQLYQQVDWTNDLNVYIVNDELRHQIRTGKTNEVKPKPQHTKPDGIPPLKKSSRTQKVEPVYLSTRSSQLPVSIDGTIQPVDTERLQKQAEEEQKKKDEENKAKRKENIKSAIDDYKTLSDAAVEAYDKIIKAQIEALDKEISLREKRVEEAKKLAERGNVEALRLEEERLRKAQEQRARFARQQQIVNSAITVSNAIAAVARAALEGGGFGSAATIAALIAALAAGYAAVTSLGSSADSFADGVVGYKGKGGPRDDKNWVRISSGESIITAEGTQKNRALLEAINQGAALHMIDPSLPLMIPTFKQPGVTNNNNYAAAKDLKQLEGKLDEVVGAIEDNRLRQNIFFNEQGVGIMTERAVKKERKRWM